MIPADRWGRCRRCLIAGMLGSEQAAEHTAARMEQIGTQRKRTSFRRSRCPNASWQPVPSLAPLSMSQSPITSNASRDAAASLT